MVGVPARGRSAPALVAGARRRPDLSLGRRERSTAFRRRDRQRPRPLSLEGGAARVEKCAGGAARGTRPQARGQPAAGETSIRFIPGQRIMVDARVNGNADAKLLLDTGSDKTIISPRALQAAGVRIAGPTTTAEVAGATGSAQMPFVVIDSLEV